MMWADPLSLAFFTTFFNFSFIFEHRLRERKRSQEEQVVSTGRNRTESNRIEPKQKNHIHYHTHTNNKLELITGKSGELKVYLCCLESICTFSLTCELSPAQGKTPS